MKKLFTVIGLLFSATGFAQNVGIGETNPIETRLQVKRSDSALLLLHNPSNGTDVKTGMFFKTGNAYSGSIFTTGNVGTQTFRMGLATFGSGNPSGLIERISILDGGNVGIGTTTPNYLLDINGRARLRHNGNTSGIWYNKADNSDGSFVGMNNDTTFGFYGSNGWSSVFDIKNSRLGIGTLTPTAPLSFPGTLGNKIALWGNAAGGHYGLGIQGNLLQIYSQGTADDIVLGYGNSTAFTENMRVKGNGNVGIGTNNPGAKLDVNGTVKISGGSPGDGKVLTSDATGNATWKAQAYGNTVRFQFHLYKFTGPNNVLLETVYNNGSAVTNHYINSSSYSIDVIKSGLYHFEINAEQILSSVDYSQTSANPKIMEVTYNLPSFYISHKVPFYKVDQFSNCEASISITREVYITAPKTLVFSCFNLTSANNDQYKLNVTGHLIAE